MSSRRSVVLPAPEGPIKNTNSPLSIPTETSESAGCPEYSLLTLSKRIISERYPDDNRDTTYTIPNGNKFVQLLKLHTPDIHEPGCFFGGKRLAGNLHFFP